MASRGEHRALALVDALVAPLAEMHGLVVLHHNSDLDLVGTETGQTHQWVVPRGTPHAH